MNRTAVFNPYPGLRPFREDEEQYFFGREGLVDHMVDILAAARFLAVVGSSGSGKSSLVFCGLIPALHRGLIAAAAGGWRVAKMRPGSRPLLALADALADPQVLPQPDLSAAGFSAVELLEVTLRAGKRGLVEAWREARPSAGQHLLLVVDQFEELFRYRGLGERGPVAGDEAVAFVNLLLEAAAEPGLPVYVVLTMRSDFLGECTQFTGLPEAINRSQFLVPRMSRGERRAAIGGPARVAGTEVDPVLLTQLVNDVGDNPDQLSLLQHALNRTWSEWLTDGGHGSLTEDHYRRAGRMEKALNLHADSAWEELTEGRQRALCEALFKAVTDRGTDARGVRRPTRFDELMAITGASAEELIAVMRPFRDPSRAFLVPPFGLPVSPDTPVDISHESLMRVWDRLQRWSEDEARSAQSWRRLAETAELHCRHEAGLLEPPELDSAKAWRTRQQPRAAWAQRYRVGFAEAMAFLQESERAWGDKTRQEAVAETERRQKEAQQLHRETRARQNLYWGIALAGVLGVATVAMVGLWQDARQEAETARRALAEADKARVEADKAVLDARQDALNARNLLAEKQRLEYTLARGKEALDVALQGATAGTQARVEKALNDRPLVYIQYAEPAQAQLAQRLSRQLNEAGYSSPGVEKVGSVPLRNELRYFRAEDAEVTRKLQTQLESWGAGPMQPRLVSGKQQARPLQQFELWLAGSGRIDLAARVADLNSEDRATRLSAGQLLQSQYRDSPEAIGLVLDTFEPPRLDALTAEGRINGLYFLSRSDAKAWTQSLLQRGRAVASNLEARESQGIRLGPQTRAEVDAWKQKVLNGPKAN